MDLHVVVNVLEKGEPGQNKHWSSIISQKIK